MSFDAIHQARLAVVDGDLDRAKVWAAIAQAEATKKLADCFNDAAHAYFG